MKRLLKESKIKLRFKKKRSKEETIKRAETTNSHIPKVELMMKLMPNSKLESTIEMKKIEIENSVVEEVLEVI